MSDICQAISDLRLISFDYDDHYRVVEPHIYGVDKKGHHALRAYQVRGYTKLGQLPDWRFFHVDRICRLTILQETFAGPRDGYKRSDSAFATIQCQL